MKIKALLFDFDNTIYPEKEYFTKVFQEFCVLKKLEFEQFEFFFSNFDYLRFNERDIFKYALHQVGKYSVENHKILFHLYLGISTIILPYTGIEFLIENVITQKIDIYILTNGIPEAQRNKWRNLNLKYKDNVIFQPSREIGNDKPCSETYKKMVEKINLTPQEILFIGDRYENDVQWGVQNNSRGVLFNSLDKNCGVLSFDSPFLLCNFIRNII